MDDRKLQELAAEAAGYQVRWHENWRCFVHAKPHNTDNAPTIAGQRHVWSPLTDDGDALRLAVKLSITDLALVVGRHVMEEKHREGDDIYAITRRAITRAAAAMANVAPGAGGGGR